MNQSLENTVSGSSTEEGWWGIEDGDKLRELIKEYPQICMFNGLTQWTLNSDNTMYQNQGEGAIFNAAAVCGLWHSYNKVEGEAMDGSQGYYVKVFDDKILVLGRDFTTGEWVSSAQFAILTANEEDTNKDTNKDTNEGTGNEVTDPDTTPDTTPDITPDITEPDNGLEKETVTQTESTIETTQSDISTDTFDEVGRKGCRSSLTAPIIALIATGGAIFTINKKRKD